MPALASPVADERSALREYLAYHQSAFFAVAYGLTDEQARMTPTVSELSIGGLGKHAAEMERNRRGRGAAGAGRSPARPRRTRRRAIRDRSTRSPKTSPISTRCGPTRRWMDC